MKPMLINGFPRSGTTYLFDYLRWYEWTYGMKRYVLLEPTFDLRRSRWIYHKGRPQKPIIGKEHYSLISITLKYKWAPNFYIYDERDVIYFLEKLKGHPMKTINLHLYLDLAKEHWEVYHIIRHPANVYISIRQFFFKMPALIDIYDKLRFLRIPDIHPYYVSSRLFMTSEKGIDFRPKNFLEAFTVVWTFTNLHAVKSVGNNLLIYDKPETLSKLPKIDEFFKRRKFVPKRYEKEAKVLEKMKEIVKRIGIEEEFNTLLSLFG